MEIKISKELENQIDSYILVAKKAKEIRDENPVIWGILSKQFLPERMYNDKHIPDTEENLKVRLYAEMIKKKNEMASKVSNKLEEK